jgi:hypothetical protein
MPPAPPTHSLPPKAAAHRLKLSSTSRSLSPATPWRAAARRYTSVTGSLGMSSVPAASTWGWAGRARARGGGGEGSAGAARLRAQWVAPSRADGARHWGIAAPPRPPAAAPRPRIPRPRAHQQRLDAWPRRQLGAQRRRAAGRVGQARGRGRGRGRRRAGGGERRGRGYRARVQARAGLGAVGASSLLLAPARRRWLRPGRANGAGAQQQAPRPPAAPQERRGQHASRLGVAPGRSGPRAGRGSRWLPPNARSRACHRLGRVMAAASGSAATPHCHMPAVRAPRVTPPVGLLGSSNFRRATDTSKAHLVARPFPPHTPPNPSPHSQPDQPAMRAAFFSGRTGALCKPESAVKAPRARAAVVAPRASGAQGRGRACALRCCVPLVAGGAARGRRGRGRSRRVPATARGAAVCPQRWGQAVRAGRRCGQAPLAPSAPHAPGPRLRAPPPPPPTHTQ